MIFVLIFLFVFTLLLVTGTVLRKQMTYQVRRWIPKQSFLLYGCTALVLVIATGCTAPNTPTSTLTNTSPSSSAKTAQSGTATKTSKGRVSTQSTNSATETIDLTGPLVPVVVSKNTDGDTIYVRLPNGQDKTIRMLLIDTPEDVKPNTPIEPYSLQAAAYAKQVLPVGRHIYIQEGRPGYTLDKYGRLLAYVFITKSDMYNLDVVRMGLARVAYIYPPNTDYLSTLDADQAYAKARHLDIWSIPGYVMPNGYNVTIAVQWDKAHNYGGYSSTGSGSSSGSTNSSGGTSTSTSSSGSTSSTASSTGTSGLSVVSSTLTVSRGGEASVTVKTKPGALGSIEVDYKSGPSHAKGLTSQTANSQGLITWQWEVGTSTSLGTWPVHISAGGKSITVYLHVN